MRKQSSAALLSRSTVALIVSLMFTDAGHAQQNLPAIVGTQLSDTSTFQVDISIDGERIDVTGFNRGGYLPDADGDGLVEAYLKTIEPGQTCQTLIYLPSRQARSAALSSDNLEGYTRIRNFGATLDESDQVVCPDNSARLRNFGDLNGDGIDEIATQYNYNGELIFDGSVTYGSLIDAANPTPGQVTRVADDLEVNPIGDINGDGLEDWSMYSYNDSSEPQDVSLIIASQAGALRSTIDFASITSDTPLASFSRNSDGSFPSMRSVGDVNGDGIGDIVINDAADYWLVHGQTQIALDDDYRNEGYRIFDTCSYDDCQQIIDFDADGYDDVLMEVSGIEHDSLLDGTGSLIVYGGPEGLLSADDITSVPASRLTQVVQKYGKPKPHSSEVVQPELTGDINGDGASDLILANAIDGYELAASIVFGTPGYRPAFLIEASIDGSNGIRWVESNAFYGNPGPGDVNGDGFDELAYIDTFIPGSGALERAADPRGVFLFNGPDSLDATWQAPDDVTNLSGYRLLLNEREVATLPLDTTKQRIIRSSSGDAEELRIQSIDTDGNVVGEAVRTITSDSPDLAAQQQRLGDVEFTARGDRIAAQTYTLRRETYGPSLGELFWDTTKRFVLIWRNGEIIDRVEGNSYMVQENGEYFITIDYLGDVPESGTAGLLTSGTLRRSNLVGVNQRIPDESSPPSRPVTDQTPTPPANLRAQVYSSTTAELFWDRAAAGTNVTSYDIVRDGVPVGSTNGTSYLDTSRTAEQGYRYTVTAISRDELRSSESRVDTQAFNARGNEDSTPDVAALPLSGLVYSSSALELFWNTDSISGALPSRYQVTQNGEIVATSDGRSYFTRDLASSTDYRYQLIGLDAAGSEVARSAELTLTTR